VDDSAAVDICHNRAAQQTDHLGVRLVEDKTPRRFFRNLGHLAMLDYSRSMPASFLAG
jgi:hypothetical protein